MCNFLHKNYEKILEKGIGWKLFAYYEDEEGEYFTVSGARSYLSTTNFLVNIKREFVEWRGCYDGNGFCFLTEEKEAFRLLKNLQHGGRYPHVVVRKIEYEDGLGCH